MWLEETFWKAVKIRGPDECWEWTKGKSSGYGAVAWQGRKVRGAHVIAYCLAIGPIPDDKPHILHSCDNPPCCNPKHLRAGTRKDNMRESAIKGRHRMRNDRHPKRKLDWPLVHRIRREYRLLLKQGAKKYGLQACLARKYNLTRFHLHDILAHDIWNVNIEALFYDERG
jgi:hypothetical protein